MCEVLDILINATPGEGEVSPLILQPVLVNRLFRAFLKFSIDRVFCIC